MGKYGIIGFGYAAINAVDRIRGLDPKGDICVFEMAHGAVNPMLTTYYVAGKIDESRLTPFGSMDELAHKYGFRVIPERVSKLDVDTLTINYGHGEERFEKILVATGADPFVPHISGDEHLSERIFPMRTYEDAIRMRMYLGRHPIHDAVVLGASMVGIKIAELLAERDVEVTIADLADRMFATAADKKTSSILQDMIAAKGICSRFGVSVRSISEDGIVLSDGTFIKSDILCVCIGTRPRIEIARGVLNTNKAIVVNDRMETSASCVYAGGDCCEALNLCTGETGIVGLWANAAAQGQTAGENMAGGDAAFGGSLPSNITHFMGIDFVGIGFPNQDDTAETIKTDTGYFRFGVLNEAPAVNMIGEPTLSGVVKNIAATKLRKPNASVSLFSRSKLMNHLNRLEIDRITGGNDAEK